MLDLLLSKGADVNAKGIIYQIIMVIMFLIKEISIIKIVLLFLVLHIRNQKIYLSYYIQEEQMNEERKLKMKKK